MMEMTIGLRVLMVVRAFGPGHYELGLPTMAGMVADIRPRIVIDSDTMGGIIDVEIIEALAGLDRTDEALAEETGSARTFRFIGMKQVGGLVYVMFERENPSLGASLIERILGSGYPTVVGETVL